MTNSNGRRPSLRQRATRVRALRCKRLIAVVENPADIRDIGSFIRNVNALGVDKAYIVSKSGILANDWQAMRERPSLLKVSASAIKWTFVKVVRTTSACFEHLERHGFASIVTRPSIWPSIPRRTRPRAHTPQL
ncbi:RNA methyltransferase, partial [Acidithiobacillus caldus]|uniref:hypothetical protein n=3 Tax=Acidithiobacillus caldus TaxID=33059 RepID=UPI001C0614F0